MPPGQMNKRFGLQKLKKIAGGMNPKWFVSPHIIISSPTQLRANKLNGAKRALVRTDEKGKKYSLLDWREMPRFDTQLMQPTTQTRRPINHIQKEIAKREAIDQKIWREYRKKRILIIHPTRPRKEMAYCGQIKIYDFSDEITVRLFESPGDTKVHRSLLKGRLFVFKTIKGKLMLTRTVNQDLTKGNHKKAATQREETIAKRICEFLEKGIRERQINPRRRETEISFVTWKDAPTKIEFFDLIEQRGARRKQAIFSKV